MAFIVALSHHPGPKIVARRAEALLLLALSFGCFTCRTGAKSDLPGASGSTNESVPRYGYEVVRVYPHDPAAFTQGLVVREGKLVESTGQEGRSSLRRVELETGNVVQKVDIPSPYFAEGLTVLKDKVYQLTWQHQKGFVYDPVSFAKIGEFNYQGEGWGLTNDGESLILSDGTNRLRFLDPGNFQVRKTIAVLDANIPVINLNELEYVRGEIYANIWHKDRVVRVNPHTGRIMGWVDLSGLLSRNEVVDEEAVLNGIAYDDKNDRLFVTGKLWPKLFEIRLRRMN